MGEHWKSNLVNTLASLVMLVWVLVAFLEVIR